VRKYFSLLKEYRHVFSKCVICYVAHLTGRYCFRMNRNLISKSLSPTVRISFAKRNISLKVVCLKEIEVSKHVGSLMTFSNIEFWSSVAAGRMQTTDPQQKSKQIEFSSIPFFKLNMIRVHTRHILLTQSMRRSANMMEHSIKRKQCKSQTKNTVMRYREGRCRSESVFGR
jgi:hypothetical protein